MRQRSKQFKAFITDAIPTVPITENRKKKLMDEYLLNPRFLSGTKYD